MKRLIVCLILLISTDFEAYSQWDEIPISYTTVMFSVDMDNSGIAYAGGAKLYKSNDFGLVWNEVDFVGTNATYYDFVTFNDIKIVNSNLTYAAGRQYSPDYPVILKTSDNGLNWSHTVLSNNIGEIFGVDFIDNMSGVAVGSDGFFYWTNDGGVNWNSESTTTAGIVYNDVIYASSNLIIAVGNFDGNGVISQSTNGGQSWTTNLTANRNFVSVDYNSALGLYTVVSSESGDSYLLKSSDNGITWIEETLFYGAVNCHYVLNPDTLFLGYSDGLITNFQNNFFEYSNLSMKNITDMDFAGDIGLAVSLYDNAIYRYVTSSPGNVIQKVDFEIDGTHCIGDQVILTPTNSVLDSYEWFINDISISNNYQLNHTFSGTDSGPLEIKLVTNYNGYFDTIVHNTVVAFALSLSDFTTTLDTVVCENPTNQYFWVYGFANSGGYKLLKDGVELTPNLAQTNNVRYLLPGYSTDFEIEMIKWKVNSCDSISISKIFTVEVDSYSDFNQSFYSLDSLVCINDSSEIIVPNPDSLYTYELYQNGQLIYSELASNDTLNLPTGTISSDSEYSITTASPYGCSRVLTSIDSINIELVSANFDILSGYIALDSILYIDTMAIIGEIFDWSVTGNPATFLDLSLINPTIIFDSLGQYTINLVVETVNMGCLDSLTESINVFTLAPDSTNNEICWVKDVTLPIILETSVDLAGNIIHVGYVREQVSWMTANYAVIQKYDSNGDLLWEYKHPNLGAYDHKSSIFGSVTTDEFGNIYLTGCAEAEVFQYPGFDYEIISSAPVYTFLMKLSPDGDFLWWNVSDDYTLVGGFADVLVVDDLLLSSINNCPRDITFQNQIISDPNGNMRGVRIIKMDLDGNYMEEYYASSSSSLLQNTGCSTIIPHSSYPNRRAIVGPELFMSSDSLLYVSGEIRENITFGNNTLESPTRLSYIGVLDIYNNYPEDWVNSVKSSPFDYGGGLSSSLSPIMKTTIDNEGSIYQVINWTETQNAPYNEYKYFSKMWKFNSDLDWDWEKNYNTGYQGGVGLIKDIYSIKNNIFFVGTQSGTWGSFLDGEPEYILSNTNSSNFIIGSFNKNGELTWVQPLDSNFAVSPNAIGGTKCGDLLVTGTRNNLTPFNFILNGVDYDTITDDFMFKLTDSICVAGGCYTLCSDSTLIPNPTINYTDSSVVTSNYPSYQWFFNGDSIQGATNQSYLYTNNGEYSVSVVDLAGCNGANHLNETCLNLDLFEDTLVYFDENIVGTGLYSTYQWFLNGSLISGATNQTYPYSQNGNYSVIVTDSNNCSKELILNETCLNQAYSVTPIINENNGVLNSNSYTSYQWYYNNNPITGATDQFYDYSEYGNYYVSVVDENSCEGVSDIIEITGLGVSNSASVNDYNIYPNPTTGFYTLVLNKSSENIVFDLVNINGASCYSSVSVKNDSNGSYKFDISHLENGVYLLKFINNNRSYSIRVVKI